MSRDVMKSLSDATLVAMCCRGDAWPRPVFGDTPIPDAWMALVETPDRRRRFAPAGEDPHPGRDDSLLLVRNRAITVPLAVRGFAASCGHAVDGAVEILIKWGAREDDLAALRDRLVGGDTLTLDALAKAVVDSGGERALRQFVAENPAAVLVRDNPRDACAEALREGLKRFLFECGATLERVARLDLTSRTLAATVARQREAAERVEHIKARELVEQAALAAAHRRVDEMSGLFDKLKAAAEADSGRQWREMLPALTPGERGRLLENLWRVTPDQAVARAFVAVVGEKLVWIDPHTPTDIVKTIGVDGVARTISPCESGASGSGRVGGLRSVSYDAPSDRVLVGATRGVHLLHADTGDVLGTYEVPGITTPPNTGFNAATIVNNELFATHSQLGCWSWPLDRPTDARCILQPAEGQPSAIRSVIAIDGGRILFAADDCVHRCENATLSTLEPVGATIHSLAVLDNYLYVGTASGLLLRDTLDGSQGVWEVLHRASGPIESIQPRRWNDLVELVIPAGPQGVCGIFPEEGFVARLMDSRTPIRRARACDDAIVALNELRDRIVVLTSGMHGRVGHEVPLARLTGASVQDVCIITASPAPVVATAVG